MQLVSAESETIRPIQTACNQFLLADDPVPAFDQIREKVEDFGLDWQKSITSTQLASVGVERIVVEEIKQLAVPDDGGRP